MGLRVPVMAAQRRAAPGERRASANSLAPVGEPPGRASRHSRSAGTACPAVSRGAHTEKGSRAGSTERTKTVSAARAAPAASRGKISMQPISAPAAREGKM